MTPDYISPEETEIEKQQLIRLFKDEVKIHAFLDLTSFIKEHSTIHNNHTHPGFVKSVAFKLEMTGDYEVIPSETYEQFSIKKLPNKTLEQRHPEWVKIGLLFLGAGLTMLGSILTKSKLPQPIYKIEDTRTVALYDSLKNIRIDIKTIQDTLTKRK